MHLGNSFCLCVELGGWANVCYLCQKRRDSYRNAIVTSTPGRCHMRQPSQHLACAPVSSDILTGCQDSEPQQGDATLLRELVTLDLSPPPSSPHGSQLPVRHNLAHSRKAFCCQAYFLLFLSGAWNFVIKRTKSLLWGFSEELRVLWEDNQIIGLRAEFRELERCVDG